MSERHDREPAELAVFQKTEDETQRDALGDRLRARVDFEMQEEYKKDEPRTELTPKEKEAMAKLEVAAKARLEARLAQAFLVASEKLDVRHEEEAAGLELECQQRAKRKAAARKRDLMKADLDKKRAEIKARYAEKKKRLNDILDPNAPDEVIEHTKEQLDAIDREEAEELARLDAQLGSEEKRLDKKRASLEVDAYKDRVDLKKKMKEKKKKQRKIINSKDKTAKEKVAAKKVLKEIEREAAQELAVLTAQHDAETKAVDAEKSLLRADAYKSRVDLKRKTKEKRKPKSKKTEARKELAEIEREEARALISSRRRPRRRWTRRSRTRRRTRPRTTRRSRRRRRKRARDPGRHQRVVRLADQVVWHSPHPH